MRKKFKSKKQAQYLMGYRSGLEEKVSEQLTTADVDFGYETDKIKYLQPAKTRTYTPDFILTKKDGSKLYIETKGYWPAAERQKMAWIVETNPHLDIRIVFSNANNKITKSSKTTYGMVASKLGILFAEKQIPDSWLNE